MNTHGGSYPYYSEEMSGSYNHPRQNSGNYATQNQMTVNPNMGGYNQYSGYEENNSSLPQQNHYNAGGHMYSLQHAPHHSQSYMNQHQHYNNQYQNSYGMLSSNMESARGNLPYNHGHEHMQNSVSSQNQLPQHSQMRQISQQNPQEIANNILQMATSNYIPNNTVQVPLNKNRSGPYQTPHSPPYNTNTSYNMPMHPSIQTNQHFSYSNHSPHQLSNMRTSPISPMHMNSPMSHHSGQSLANSSPGSVQSPANSNSVKSPVPTPPNVMGSIRSPHRKQPLASPTGSTHSLKSPTPNQHVHNSGSQSISSPHNALGNMQSPGPHPQSHYSPVSCSPHSHVGSPYQVSRNQTHSPVNQLNQQNTGSKYMSEPQDFSNYVQATPFNPLQSLQKLVMLPEKQVVDPKSVVGNSNVHNSTAAHEMSDLCNSHQNFSKNLTASPEQCLPEQTRVLEGSEHISQLPNSLLHSSVQEEEMCRDGRHCSGESNSLSGISSNGSIQDSESHAQNNMFSSGQHSDDQTEKQIKKTSLQMFNSLHETCPIENHKYVHEQLPKQGNLCGDGKKISQSCEKTSKDSIENPNSVIDKENGIDVDKSVSSCDNLHTCISVVQKQSCDELYGKHKWVKDCNASKTNNTSVGNPVDDDMEKVEVRKNFASNYSRDSRYSVTPKKRYTQRLNYIEKNLAGENMESASAIPDSEDRTLKPSVENGNSVDNVSENIPEESANTKVQPAKSDVSQNCSEQTEECSTEKVEPEECIELNISISNDIVSDEPSQKIEESESEQSGTKALQMDNDVTDASKESLSDNSVVTKPDKEKVHKLNYSEKSEQKNSEKMPLQNSISEKMDEPEVKNDTPTKGIKQKILSEVNQTQNDVVLRRSARKRNFIDKFQSFSTPKEKSNIYNFHQGKNANASHNQIKPSSTKQSVSSSEIVDKRSDHLVKEEDKRETVSETDNSQLNTKIDKKTTVTETEQAQLTSFDKPSFDKASAVSGNKEKPLAGGFTIISPVKKRRKITEKFDEGSAVDRNIDNCDNVPIIQKESKPSLPSKKMCENDDLFTFDVSVMEISADSIDPSVICADSSNSNSSMCPLSDRLVGEKMPKMSSINDSKQSHVLCNKKSPKVETVKPKINKTVKKPKPKTFDLSDDEALKRMKLSKTLVHMSQTKKKKEGNSVGPFIHVESSKNSPVHCKIINQTQEEVLDLKNKRKLNVSSKASPSVQISNIPTEKSVFLPSNKLLAESEWVCALCKKHSCYKTLGDLFGPYFAEGYDPSIHCDTKSGKKTSSKSPNVCDNERRSKRLKGKPPYQNSAIDKTEPEGFDKTKEYWFHEDCVLWSDGVILVGSKVYGLEETIELVASTNCSSCKLFGATLGCLHKGCAQKYHFICAKEKGCYFDEENFSLLCLKHKDKKLKAAESKKSSTNDVF